MRFELFVALRYLLAPRRQAFISVVSLVSMRGRRRRRDGAHHRAGAHDRAAGRACAIACSARWRTSTCTEAGGFADYHADVEKLRADARRRSAPRPAVMGKALVVQGPTSTRSSPSRASIPALEVERHRHPHRRCTSGRLEDLAARTLEDGTEDLPGHPARPRTGRASSACRSGTRVSAADAAGHAVAARRHAAAAPVRGRRHVLSSGFFEFDTAYGLVSLDFGERLMSARRARPDSDSRARPLRGARHRRGEIEATMGAGYRRAGLGVDEPVALLGAVAREDGRSRSPSALIVHRRRAQHHLVARPDGDAEEPRHRHPEDDGGVGAQHLPIFIAQGTGDRHRRHRRRRRRRPGAVLARWTATKWCTSRSTSTRCRTCRSSCWCRDVVHGGRWRRSAICFARHHLSVAPGRAARSRCRALRLE